VMWEAPAELGRSPSRSWAHHNNARYFNADAWPARVPLDPLIPRRTNRSGCRRHNHL